MSKIRFILAIILSLSILSNGLLAEGVRSLESIPSELIRKKRDIHTFRVEDLFGEENSRYYDQLIDYIRESFSGGNSITLRSGQNIQVAGSNNPYTLVELQNDRGSVRLVFSNRDTYLIGFIVGNNFYRGSSFSHITVPNTAAYDFIRGDLSYSDLRIGQNTNIEFSNSSDLINPLLSHHNDNHLTPNAQAGENVRKALGRLVIMMADAARFKVVQHLVRDALRTYGSFRMNQNVFAEAGVIYPDHILTSNILTISWLTKNWEKLSGLLSPLREYFAIQSYFDVIREHISLSARDLLAVLALAHSCASSMLDNQPGPSRYTRDTETHSSDKCHLGDIGREGIMTGNTYWDSNAASILISEILDTHIIYGVSSTIYVRDEL